MLIFSSPRSFGLLFRPLLQLLRPISLPLARIKPKYIVTVFILILYVLTTLYAHETPLLRNSLLCNPWAAIAQAALSLIGQNSGGSMNTSKPMAGSFWQGLGQSLGAGDSGSLGSIAGAVAGNIGQAALGGSGLFRTSIRKQWRYQQKQMKLAQRYALEQMAESARLNYENWQKQFDYQNEYNNPSALMQRWSQAGINPSAVLGSSGVQVQGTQGTSASGVSGGAPHSSGFDFGQTPAQGMLALSGLKSQAAERNAMSAGAAANQASANRDNAEARAIENRTQSKEYYASIAALNESISRANVDNAQAVARMNAAMATIYQADADVASTTVGYRIEDLISRVSLQKEEYELLRKYNVEYFDRAMTAAISLDTARAVEALANQGVLNAESELKRISVQDAQNWFDVNWNVEVDVPRYDEKGKVTKVEKYTGKDIAMAMRAVELSTSDLELGEQRWRLRSEKNRLGYDCAKAFSAAVGYAAASYVSGGRGGVGSMANSSTGGSQSTATEMYERYNAKGEYIGGTRVTRDFIGETHSANKSRKSR